MGPINDELGLPVGDQVLEQVASRLKRCLREYDVVARFEDDEFGVLLPGADASRRASWAIASRRPWPLGQVGPGRRPSPVHRRALWVPPSGETSEDIVKRAGTALREARKQGGARY